MPKVNVLMVDDRPENLLALDAMLEGMGVNLIKAASGEAALRHLLEYDFAVILLDVQMQGMNGIETAQLIKERPRAAHTPIIFLTGLDASEVQIFRGYSVGAVDYLVKPIVPEILRAKVATFVELFTKTEEVRLQAKQIEAINHELTRQLQEIQRLHRNVDEQKRATQEQQQLLIFEQTARAAAEAVQQRMAFLAKASAVLSSSLEYETTLTNVTRLVVPEMADWCAVHLIEEDGSVRQLAVQHSNPTKIALVLELQRRYPDDINAGHGVYHVLRTGEPELYSAITGAMLVATTQNDEHLRMLQELGFASAMIVPCMAGGQILGALTFVTAESGRHYVQDDLQLAQNLANRSALAVENARLYRQMSRQREHLEVTLTSIGDGVITTDTQGQITLINAVAEALTGYSWEEAIGKDITEIFHIVNEQTRESVENPLTLVFQDGRIVGLANHTLLISKGGIERPIDDSGAPIKDEQDNIIGAILVFRDITERKRAETLQSFLVNASAILASSFNYEETLKVVTELIIPVLADWCVITVLQDSGQPETATIIYSIPGKRALLEGFGRRYPFDPEGPSGVAHVLRTGKSLFLPEIDSAILKERTRDAEHLALVQQLGTTSAMIVPILARGRVLGSISFNMAETQRRYTQNDLEFAEELAQRAGIAIDNARLYRDTQQARQSAEWAAERTTRLQVITALLSRALTPEQVSDVILEQGLSSLGAVAGSVALLDDTRQSLRIVSSAGYPDGSVDPWRSFSIEENVPLSEATRQKAPVWISSFAVWKERYPQLASDESLFPEAAWAALPLIVEGQAIGALGLSFSQAREFGPEDQGFMLALAHHCAQAIRRALLFEAERKAVAEAQAALRVRDEFLSVAAHELKTPITSLRGFSQATLRQLDRNTSTDMKRVRRALQAIDQQSVKLTKLVSQLLDISRIEGGRLALDRQPTDVTALVEGLANQAQVNTKRHTITVDAVPNLQAQVDAMRLEQVITNLIDNAIKYSPEGGPIKIDVSIEADGTLAIRVTDQGLGIAPEHREKIFERFYQAHNISVQGMGLGLYISRQIVQLHGGTISAEFPREGGSSFIVCIPPEPIEADTKHH